MSSDLESERHLFQVVSPASKGAEVQLETFDKGGSLSGLPSTFWNFIDYYPLLLPCIYWIIDIIIISQAS
jgi:hypothetical protein